MRCPSRSYQITRLGLGGRRRQRQQRRRRWRWRRTKTTRTRSHGRSPSLPSPPVLFAHVGEDTKAKIEKQLIHSSSRITRFTLGRDEWRGILNLMAMPLPRNSSFFFAMQYFLLWNEFEWQNKRMIDQRPMKKKKDRNSKPVLSKVMPKEEKLRWSRVFEIARINSELLAAIEA